MLCKQKDRGYLLSAQDDLDERTFEKTLAEKVAAQRPEELPHSDLAIIEEWASVMTTEKTQFSGQGKEGKIFFFYPGIL